MGDRQVCLAIGVGKSIRGSYLSGAVNGARQMGIWAQALGYEISVLTDEEDPLTLAEVRAELERLLWPDRNKAAPTTDRLIIYFAGHGLLRDAEEALWLLSDWKTEMRAIGMDALRRRLFRYPVEHLTMISDACLSLPANIDQAEIAAEGLLGSGPIPRSDPWYDRFVATQDGTTTFMVPADDPEEDRCIFTGVLLEGLWGLSPEAFSVRAPQFVTGNSLSVFLKKQVPIVSGRYSSPRTPSVSATFPEGDDVYFEQDPNVAKPEFGPWPDPSNILEMGLGRPEPPERPTREDVSVDFGEGSAEDFVVIDRLDFRPIRGSIRRRTAARGPVGPVFPPIGDQLRTPPPPSLGDFAKLGAFGAKVRALWTRPNVQLGRAAPEWWGQSGGRDRMSFEPLLVEFADGAVAATILQPSMVTKVARDGHGAAAILMPEQQGHPQRSERVIDVLARMERGELKADAILDTAVDLRQDKHVDPVLGVVAAYLYDSIGDVDSIRRMAFFYVKHRQPIPYDIAFLGLVRGWHVGEQLVVSVPAVAARKPRTSLEESHRWAYQATPAVEGPVAGDWPWMRQGWTLLDDVTDEESTLIVPELLDVARHLTPGRFTTLDLEGARLLADRFGLQRRAQ